MDIESGEWKEMTGLKILNGPEFSERLNRKQTHTEAHNVVAGAHYFTTNLYYSGCLRQIDIMKTL